MSSPFRQPKPITFRSPVAASDAAAPALALPPEAAALPDGAAADVAGLGVLPLLQAAAARTTAARAGRRPARRLTIESSSSGPATAAGPFVQARIGWRT